MLTGISSSCKQDNSIGHCSDNILNFDETSVDCGGSCAACQPPDCDDGIQNQNEFAIDCGGPCTSCEGLFSGIIDFKNIYLIEGADNYILTTTVYSKNISGNSCNKDFYSFLFNSVRTNSISVTFKNLYSGNCSGPDSSQFHGLFSTGNKGFSANDNESGIIIIWYDKDGKAWNTMSGQQNGSNFNVTKSENLSPSSAYQRHKVQASFNCTVYDNAGNYLPVTNGTIIFYFGNK